MDKHEFSSVERLEHISRAVGLIIRYCDHKTETEFLEDEFLSSAVLFRLLFT